MDLEKQTYCNGDRNWSISEDEDGDLIMQFDAIKNKLVLDAEYEEDGLLQYRLIRRGIR